MIRGSGSSYRAKRRAFLRGLGALGATAGLGAWLGSAERRAEGAGAPRRLVVIQRPNGTIRNRWLPNGAGPGATLGPILEPFTDLFPRMVVTQGLDIVTSNGGNASHEGGLVTLMTGNPIGPSRPPSNDDWENTTASMDQVLATSASMLSSAPVPSVQLAAHNRQEGAPEIANLAMSYSDADAPLFPEVKPSLVYQRLFGNLLPGGMTEENAAALARARAKNKSVLDFIGADLARLDALAPASEKAKLEAHAEAIRQLEKTLDGTVSNCDPGEEPADPTDSDGHNDVGVVGEMQLALLRTALTCDITRVATFMWSAGASRVEFEGLYDGMSLVSHHPLSHGDLGSDAVADPMAAIDRWYSERTAAFIRTLAEVDDPAGGKLLDHTLVVYLSEVASGDHTFHDLPLILFGGQSMGIAGERFIDFGGRPTNDLWLTIAGLFGLPMESLGADGQSQGSLPGLVG
jgi:hypothetical protein